ncbi:hypothetical protein G647_05671 [Cladophialophora carrionii CBS 160.54]|uniref:Uncharacterized protein n=1 Tax=Cladophialophora carrionii CBS 160.54 TaxID=1279043 RepID=V9DAF2_9EURO|nr:uncharacterized protein G647_05671 [Cladophialophora carrionii CBS 160.54]ETI23864.1 hypothetical protein G647_05671 [Cladophialophora carrionii CBS 160.54]
MADDTQYKDETGDATFDHAPGGRNQGELEKSSKEAPATSSNSTPDYIPEGFSKKDIENMGGSLKVHVRLALKADIRITAEIKGDICIGIL